MEDKRPWALVEDHPALLRADWLPPEDVAPELAELRREHLRLLAARQEAADIAGATNTGYRREDEAHEAELAAALREGREPEQLKRTPHQERVRAQTENVRRYNIANDVLVEFLASAVADISERAPELYTVLDGRAAESSEKR